MTTLAIAGQESYFGAMFDLDPWCSDPNKSTRSSNLMAEDFIDRNPAAMFDLDSCCSDPNKSTRSSDRNPGAMFDLDSCCSDPNKSTRSSNLTAEHFIDRDPDYFGVLLNLLRTGHLCVPPNLSDELLYKEADFYGLMNHVRAAKWGPIYGNGLILSHSISENRLNGLKLIRASPDGGCAVAERHMVYVYDWKLMSDQPSTHFYYPWMDDMLWVGRDNIVVSGSSGMKLFGAWDGKLHHTYKIDFDKEKKYQYHTAGPIEFDSNRGHIFGSCRGNITSGSIDSGIGVWDQVTGKQVDFFVEAQELWLGKADKLGWLDGRNCLLVTMLMNRSWNKEAMGLIDFRAKKMVWSRSSWSNSDSVLTDAVAVGESIYTVNKRGGLATIDMRGRNRKLKMHPGWKPIIPNNSPYNCNCKLAFDQGQLFCSVDDCLKVFLGSDLQFTTIVRNNKSGNSHPISDFSIGGHRLFALYHQENVIDVWETPPIY